MQPVPRAQIPASTPYVEAPAEEPSRDAKWHPLSLAAIGLFLLRCRARLVPRGASALALIRQTPRLLQGARTIVRRPFWLEATGYLLVLAAVLFVVFAGPWDARFALSRQPEALGRSMPVLSAGVEPFDLLVPLAEQVFGDFPWAIVLRLVVAGWFTYGLLRSLGAGRFGAIVAAESWALGSYFVVHARQPALLEIAVWLPAVLLFGQAALAQRGHARMLALTAGGGAFGLACLSVPPGGMLLLASILWAFLAFRLVVGPVRHLPPTHLLLRRGQPARLRSTLLEQVGRVLAGIGLTLAQRSAAVLLAAAGIPAIGLALAYLRAPLLAGAALESLRTVGSTAPSVPAAAGAIQLVLPYFFRMTDGAWWGLWPFESTVLYAGLLPLCFAIFGVALSRRRATLFFASLAIAALVAAFGLAAVLPVGLGPSVTEVFGRAGLPGASILLAGFALAVLAGLGADGADRRLSRGMHRHSLSVGLLVLFPFAIAFVGMGSLAWGARWLEQQWPSALDAIRLQYLPLGGPTAARLEAVDFYPAIRQSIDPLAPATIWAAVLLVLFGFVLLARVLQPRLRPIWWLAAIVLIAADLAAFGQRYPLQPVSAVAAQAADGATRQPSSTTTAIRPPGLALVSVAPLAATGSQVAPAPSASATAVGPLGLLSAATGVTLLAIWLTLLPGVLASQPAESARTGRIWLPAPPWTTRDWSLADPWRGRFERWGPPVLATARSAWRGLWWFLCTLGRAIRIIVGWAAWMELACLLAILGVSLAFVWPVLSQGKIFYEYDTRHYYYPVMTDLQRALGEGRLPLWTPRIFGGFPLFAEGETGGLYPFKLIALRFVGPAEALGWVGLANFVVAGWGMYFYGRSLGLTRVASLIGGFAFQCSSFIVGQIHHTSLHSSAVWLPWILAGAERGIRNVGIYRLSGAAIGGGALAMACFGLHPQPVLISITLVVAYVVWRLLTGPFGFNWPLAWPGPWYVPGSFGRSLYQLLRNVSHLFFREVTAAGSRLIQIGVVLGALFGAGLGLASIQLVPLMELASRSIRQGGVEYAFASTYSMPISHLAQLLFPFAFQTAWGDWWTLWAPWETSLYAGVGTLILALLAIILVRSRLVVFFTAAAIASALVAFGEYAPIRLHEMLYHLPGFGSLRVPGRFGLLTLLSLCILAMIAVDWMDRRFCPAATKRVTKLDRLLTSITISLVGALAVALPAGLWWARRWAIEHADETLAFIKADYLSLRHGNTFLFSEQQIYQFLLGALDPFNDRTMLSLLIFGGVALSLVAWRAAPHWRHVWRLGLLAIVALDGIAFATSYHRPLPLQSVTEPERAEAWVAQHVGIERTAVLPHGKATESAALMPLGINDIGGYSSLDPQRVAAFRDWMLKDGTALVNLGNIRYIVEPNVPNPMPSYENVSVWPLRPLAEGKRENPNSQAVFAIDPFYTDSIRVISGLFDAIGVKTGEPVAEIVVSNRLGGEERLTMVAGKDTGEWAYDRPDVEPWVQHVRPKLAMKQPQIDPDGRRYEVDYFYTELPLTHGMPVDRIEFQNIHPKAGIRLFGLAAWDLNTYTSDSMTWERKEQFRQVYATDRSVVIENLHVYPKTRIVRRAVPAPIDQLGLYMMANENYNPEVMTYLTAPADFWQRYESRPEPPIGTPYRGLPWADPSWVTAYDDERVEIVAEASTPAFLVLHDTFMAGWKATIDGVETPIYRADYLYRAIAIPPGRHTVIFRYEPESIALGGLLTLVAAAGLAVLWGYTFAIRPVLVLLLRLLGWAIRHGAQGVYYGRRQGVPRARAAWRRWRHSNELTAPDWPGK